MVKLCTNFAEVRRVVAKAVSLSTPIISSATLDNVILTKSK